MMTETYTFSRPIKFRAWDKENKEWYGKSNPNGLTHYGFSLYGECMLIDPPHISEIKHIEVTQFTGLLDKNDVEIYEGDIVKNTKWFESNSHRNLMTVVFVGGCYMIETWDSEYSVELYSIGSKYNIEVIGNIYEHPHLLEVKE